MKIIGRSAERAILQKTLNSKKPELVAITGRRRVGKTYLIRNQYKSDIIFEISGINNGSKQDQILNFINTCRYYKLGDIPKSNSWIDIFHHFAMLLDQQNINNKYVLFFDELPWLATARSGFLSAFANFWNTWASKQNIVVVICGSATSWIIKNVINNKGGLHNRITHHINIRPFSLSETQLFLISKNINLSPYQLTQLYMVFGGIPMYLEYLSKDNSIAENIQKTIFDNSSPLLHEYSNLYAALYDNHDDYTRIIKALSQSNKGLSREQLVSKTKIANGGTLTKIINDLILSDFVDKYSSYGKKTKSATYKLKDFFSLFYHRFIEDRKPDPSYDFSQIMNTPAYHVFQGYAYENVCYHHIIKIKEVLGIAAVSTKVSSYQSVANEIVPGTQIDLIIERADHCLHIVEIKFSNAPYVITKKYAAELRLKETVFRNNTGYKHQIFYTMITSQGLVENKYSKEIINQALTVDQLM
jgi:predicted AAA+ superfamily ATPase